MERRIAAILAADMVGYSRLIEQDEAGTLARQKRHMIELIRPGIERHHGTIVKLTGDGLIAEFGSVIEAVQCAVELQREMLVREEDQPEATRIRYRAAVNLGDVVFEDGDVYGDGVNIAARLEELAVPGGVVVSGPAYDLLKKNVDVAYVSMGEKRLKNISTPVRVYQVVGSDQATGQLARRHWRPVATWVAVCVLLAGSVWFFADAARSVLTARASAKPSLAVMPLENLSGDSDQDWFANGLSEDLTTDLSRHPGLFVIARSSAFETAREASEPQDVAQTLKVAYVIEGSVRRVGASLRLNIQLIDGKTGGHIWAERYDGTPEDVLAFMEVVSDEVLAALDLTDDTRPDEVSLIGETGDPKAFDAFLEGWDYYRRNTPADLKKAIPLFETAVELDPEYGRAHAALAAAYFRIYEKHWHQAFGYDYMERRWVIARARDSLALAMQNPTGLAHQVQAEIHRLFGQREDMLTEARAAVALEPGDPDGRVLLALALILEGQPDAALAEIDAAMAMEPHYPANYLFTRGIALFDLRRYDDALETLTRAVDRNPADSGPKYWIAASQASLGDLEGAEVTRRTDPSYSSVDSLKLFVPYKNSEDWEHLAQALRRAGYP